MKYAYCWIRINLSTVEKIRQHESKKSSSTVTNVLGFFSVAPFLKLFANAIVLVLFCHSCLVNKKLSHRRQRAQRDRNTRTQYQQRTRTVFILTQV